ncbi:hypothetical protein AYI69_g3304 [Smittium culicis]|uniref:Uncharacterized protein n=1 Tax=Smittium culicis TaxID=133412 RepID=A0A1R1YK63_9FUNG|nr:hypothetical protein AYI69_g3304 [Smittium culicis]
MNVYNFLHALPCCTPSPPGSWYEEDYENQTFPLPSTSKRSNGEYEDGMDRVNSSHDGSFPTLCTINNIQ